MHVRSVDCAVWPSHQTTNVDADRLFGGLDLTAPCPVKCSRVLAWFVE
jgi:hypothetical protein